MGDWSTLDVQMRQYSPRLRDDLRIEAAASNYLATTVANESAALPPDALTEIREQDVVGLHARLEELTAFQAFMDLANSIPSHPAVVRAQVITQNYFCFVYLGESCFKILQRHMPSTSTTRRCCRFLTDNPIRASQCTRSRELALQGRFLWPPFLGAQGQRPERAVVRI